MKHGILADRLRRSAALGALIIATGGAAFAQQAQQPPAPPVEQIQPPEDEDTSEKIIVTGTRIVSDSYSSPSAMTVVTADEAAVQGVTDIATLLQNSVAAAGSSQVTAAISNALLNPPGGLGTQTLSLRGLGANRTLVLLNGRRAGPAGTGGSVGPFDLNVIPLSAVERVEVLKDGASSLYGSDAIAGVVNIITKKDSSSSIDFSYTYPEIGAGAELAVSGTWGHKFEQGYFRISADYFRQDEYDRGDNDWFSCGEEYIFHPDGTRADLVDPTTGRYTCSDDTIWGQNWTYDYGENSFDNATGRAITDADGFYHRPWQDTIGLYQYDYSGTLGNFLPSFGPGRVATSGLVSPAGWIPVGYGTSLTDSGIPDPIWGPTARTSEGAVGYLHPFQLKATLSPKIERTSLIANGEFDVNDGLTLYGEALLNRRETSSDGFSQVYTFQYLYRIGADPVVGDPIAQAAGWSLRPDSTGDGYYVLLSPTAITDHADQSVKVDYFRAVAGARGDLPWDRWTFDASAQFSRSEGEYQEDEFWVDAITDYEQQTDFCAGTTTRYRGVPCVDVAWYSPRFINGELTQAEQDFLYASPISTTTYQQTTIEGYVTGPIFKLPTGDIDAVFGVSYQYDRLNDTPDQAWLDGEIWSGAPQQRGITKGTDKTAAIFTEFAIPVLKDLPYARSLDLSLSGRYTDVDSYGSDETYKIGLSWEINKEFRVRASQGTSFRAPGLYELYLADQLGQFRLSDDPCAQWGDKLADNQITQRMADNCQADPKFPGGIGPDQLSTGGIQATVHRSGGFGDLEAERSKSKTFGVIWQPSFADFQVSVDYYDIAINDEVAFLSEAFILRSCYDSTNFPNDSFCSRFTRKQPTETPPGTLKEVFNNYLNIAAQTNRGIDIEMRYGLETGIGNLDLSLKAARQLESGQQLQPDSPFRDDNGEAGEPPWVANLNATLDRGAFSFFWGVRYVDATSEQDPFTEANPETPYTFLGEEVEYVLATPPKIYHSASVSYDFDNYGVTAQLGVRNIFDVEPPRTSAASGYLRSGNSVIDSQYDLYGRTFFVNLSKKF